MRDVKIDGEPGKVEYRIEVKDNSNIIMRVGSEKNVIVTAILFAKTEFLENIKNYYKEIFMLILMKKENFLWLINKNYLILYFLKLGYFRLNNMNY